MMNERERFDGATTATRRPLVGAVPDSPRAARFAGVGDRAELRFPLVNGFFPERGVLWTVTEYPIGATRTTARVIEGLLAVEEAGVTELADRLDVSKASVHNHLVTLERLGVVVSDGGRYRLGLRFLDIGMQVRDRMALYTVARSAVADLAASTAETVSLVVPEGDEAVHAAVRRPDRNDRRVRLGSRLPLHASAAGKLFLADRTPDAVEAYVASDAFTPLTDRTVESPSPLRDRLRSVRDRGLAFDRGEVHPDMRGVAAPVRADGAVVGALAVDGPAGRLSGKRLEEDLPGLVLSTAKEVELDLTD
jgi:DNA-binding IclR family transcriptional regulator